MENKEEKKEDEKSVKEQITPFNVLTDLNSEIDFNKVVREFGCKMIDKDLLERFEKLTGQKPHHWLRRGLYFSHRDFDKILDLYEKKLPFYLYTGRGPSGKMHMGHLIPVNCFYFFPK